MFKRFFSIAIMLLFMSGCVGTMKIADAPSKNIKSTTTMQTKVDNNSTSTKK